MDSTRRIWLTLAALSILSTLASAQCMDAWGRVSASQYGSFQDIQTTLLYVGTVLGILMMVLQGVKWIISDSPEEREDAKKGIIYIIIGLIMLTTAYTFVLYMFCTV